MTQKSQSDKQRHKKPLCLWMMALLFACFCWTPAWANGLDEQQLVEKATHTVESFMGDPNLTWFQDHVKDAKALLIIPQQLKAAFFFGADEAAGVLVDVRRADGEVDRTGLLRVGRTQLWNFNSRGKPRKSIILALTDGAVAKALCSSF